MEKICHVTSAHKSTDTRIFYKECVSLAKKDCYDVYLVAPGESRFEDGVNIIGVGDKPSNRVKRIFTYSKYVIKKALEIDADIYHLHDPELLQYAKLLSRNGKIVIFDSHEEYYDQILSKEYLPKFLRKTIAEIYKNIENRACNYLDAVISTCEVEGKHPFDGRVDDCIYIDNFPIIDDMNDMEIPYEKRIPGIGCVGSLSESRGISVLIEACYNTETRLVLGGTFRPETYGDSLMKKDSFSIVDYRGFCTRDQMIDIYRNVTIGASTILNRGQYYKANNLPTKVHEFMMMGLPCILSDSNYNKSIIDEYGFGIIVDPENNQDLENAIRYLVNNKKVAKEMGEKGRRLVVSKFNWSIEERKLYELYARHSQRK